MTALEDRISNLPDEILTRILSILPIKESICTSLLSTRWVSLWNCVPTLDLQFYKYLKNGEDDECTKELLRKFVDSALVDHRMPYLSNVFVSYSDSDGSLTNSWISAAIQRNLSYLKLRAGSQKPFNLNLVPVLISGCTLVQLKLEMSVVIVFPAASPTYFPKLKLLHLWCVRFRVGNDSVTNLISSCPVLEDLNITADHEESFRKLNVSAKCLNKFALKLYVSPLNRPKYNDAPRILIDTPALEHIQIRSYAPYEYKMKDCSSLVKAEINYDSTSGFTDSYLHSRLFELLNSISNVKFLSISCWTILNLFNADTMSFPVFHNLKSLTFDGGILDWEVALAFLNSCPVLEVLTTKECVFSHESLHRSWNNDVPTCLISHLKTIEFLPERGRNGVKEIRYFLENANILEKMILEKSCKDSTEILNLPRSSSTCQIEFR